MAAKKIKKKSNRKYKDIIARVDDVPVTHREMKVISNQISSLKISIEKRFESQDTKMEAGFNRLSADIHRILAIVEEQNSRNQSVMDAQGLILHKFENHDSRISALELKVNGIK